MRPGEGNRICDARYEADHACGHRVGQPCQSPAVGTFEVAEAHYRLCQGHLIAWRKRLGRDAVRLVASADGTAITKRHRRALIEGAMMRRRLGVG